MCVGLVGGCVTERVLTVVDRGNVGFQNFWAGCAAYRLVGIICTQNLLLYRWNSAYAHVMRTLSSYVHVCA